MGRHVFTRSASASSGTTKGILRGTFPQPPLIRFSMHLSPAAFQNGFVERRLPDTLLAARFPQSRILLRAQACTRLLSSPIAAMAQPVLVSPAADFHAFKVETPQAPLLAAASAGILDGQTDKRLPIIGGHRGMGANIIRNGALAPAWRENTLRSFQAAAASGASFVEFDVQVTSDGVPVVWHDNLVEYGDPAQPTQCRVSDLTAAEFQALGQLSASGRCQQLSVVRRFRTVTREAAALSAILPPQAAPHGEPVLAQRLRWCCEADDSFPTLEQLFSSLPPSLAFNIEVKMVTPDDLPVTPAAEVQRVVKPILEVVGRCSSSSSSSSTQQQRQVVFSSFDPDICKALRAAQDQHPVLFLTTGGRDWHADPRRMSIAAAIEEAVGSCLSGVVVDSGALAAVPEAAAVARSKGLKVLTYGLENDNINWVLRQQQLGVAGIIVDDVQGLMNALNNDVSSVSSSAASEAAAVLAGGGIAEEGFPEQAGRGSSMQMMPAGDFVSSVSVPVRAS